MRFNSRSIRTGVLRRTLLIVSLAGPGLYSSLSHAMDAMPIDDGPYVGSVQDCEDLRTGNLDFIDFDVTEKGRSYGMPEVGCVVAQAKKIRPNRYFVEGDCMEHGNPPFQHNFILDVPKKGIIRINGEELAYCDVMAKDAGGGAAAKTKDGEKSGGLLSELFGGADEEVSGGKAASALIESWHDANESCRGGSGDDPKTMEACNERDLVARELADANWCYGKEWKPCKKRPSGSIVIQKPSLQQ